MRDNAGSPLRAADRGSEALLTALRAGRPEHTPEVEPVLIALHGEQFVLILDDGERLSFDALEFCTAVDSLRVRQLMDAGYDPLEEVA
jgi:hypothetical protein